MINPAHDIWVWGACLLFLVLLGARAYVVETSHAQLGRAPAKLKVLTGGIVVVLAGIIVLMAQQGGTLLVSSIINGTDPADVVYGTDDGTDAAPADPNAPADPGAPADPNAPAEPAPAGQPPAGGAAPAAPPGG